jgi:uncharacterized protein with HEPN domain
VDRSCHRLAWCLISVRDVLDMRNFLSYEYVRVRADIVRQTIDEPLAGLRAACERLLDT